jgi:hypothetical protein
MRILGDAPMKREKLDIITFKVPESLREAMRGIPNRSEFIRAAVVAALDSICPLCKGTGVIMPSQRPHWEIFANDHHFEDCETCHGVHVVCDRNPGHAVHVHEAD